MKLIKPSFEIWEQEFPEFTTIRDIDDKNKKANLIIKGIYKQIERAGRTCYKSEDKITEDSAIPFVERMALAKHYAMLEHGTVYLTLWWNGNVCENCEQSVVPDYIQKYLDNKYCKCVWQNNFLHVTTNLRVIVENGWEEDYKYMVLPTIYHEKRVTVKYTTNIQVYKEYTRHRVMSWAIESTRYCNYFKEKFGHSVNFVYPCWLKEEEVEEFEQDLTTIENIYFKWIEKGWQAQQAATFLPQATKAEVVMTGFVSDWEHFFDLRALGTTGTPHPQAKELAEPLYEEFIKRGYVQ